MRRLPQEVVADRQELAGRKDGDIMACGRSTINTVLKSGATVSALTKLCRIKSYPQLGGEPDQIETTDMEDKMQTFVEGVQSSDAMQFTINYEKDSYDAIKERIETDKFFQLEFGANGIDGIFSWQGKISVFVNEGEVNGVREATITITRSSEVFDEAASEAFGSGS